MTTEQPTEELLECPWCGPEAGLRLCRSAGSRYLIECRECVACGPKAETPMDAIAAWNRRAGESEDAD